MRRWAGALFLTGFVGILFLTTLISAWRIHRGGFLLVGVITLFGVVSIAKVLKHAPALNSAYPFFSTSALADFFAVFIGGVLTYIASAYIGFNVVLASGVIGVLAAIFIKPYAVAIFCGSFIGMSSPDLLSLPFFLLAALLASFIFILAKDVYNGVGGKLGTIALAGVFLICMLINQSFLEAGAFDGMLIVWVIVFGILGALSSNMLNIRFQQGAVMGSAIVGVLAGGFLPVFFDANGLSLAVVAFGASFAGMSSRTYLPSESWTIVSGFIFSVLFIYSAESLGGVGGKLGTIAFAAVLSVHGIEGFTRYITEKVVKSA